MENSNIVLLKHHFVNFQDVKNTAFYRNQCPDIDDRIIIDVTSRVVRDKEFLKEHPNFPNCPFVCPKGGRYVDILRDGSY